MQFMLSDYHDYTTSSSPEYTYSPYDNKSGIALQQPVHIPQHQHHGIINNFPVKIEYMRFPEKLYKTQVNN